MKKILTLLCCIVAVCATGQTTIPNSRYAYKTLADALSTIKADGLKVTISDPLAGGNFILRDTADGYKADGGMNIDFAGTSKLLSRISNERYRVYLSWFGGKQDSTFNSTFAYEAAAAYLKKLGGGAVVIDGTYWMDSVKLYNRISIVGTAFGSSTLISRKITMNANKPTGFFILDKGPVVLANVSDLNIYANNRVGGNDTAVNRGQWGAYLRSQFDANNSNGGYWNSVWNNVNMIGYDSCMWLRGGYSAHHSSLPIQHITFNKIDFEVRGGIGFRATGQQGQMTFNGGKIKGIKNVPGSKALIDVEITYDPRPYEVANNGVKNESTGDIAGTFIAARKPGNYTFQDGFNAANSVNAYFINGGAVDHFKNGWVENATIAYRIGGSARLYLTGQRISNGAVTIVDTTQGGDEESTDDTSGTVAGTIFLWGGKNAFVEWDASNNIAGAADRFLTFENGITVARMGRLLFTGPLPRLSTDSAFFPTSSPYLISIDSTHRINVEDKATIFLNAGVSNPAGIIDSIKGYTAPDNMILFRPISTITITPNGNIGTVGGKTYTYVSGSNILAQRTIGNPSQFVIINAPNNRLNAIPADSGYYANGTIINNSITGVGQSLGWQCISAGYSVNDSVATANSTTPRAVWRPMNTSINGVPGTEQTIAISNSTNPNTVLGIVDNVPLQSHTINIPMADSTKAGFLSINTQYIPATKIFMSPPIFQNLVNSIAGDSILVMKSNNHNVGRAALSATLPLSINTTAGNYNFKIDTGRGTSQVVTGGVLKAVTDSLGAKINTVTNTAKAIPYFITDGNGALTAGTSNYAMAGAGSFSTDSLQRNSAFPVAGTIANLVVVTGGTQDATGSLTLTFKSGSTATGATNSTVVATVAASAGSGKYTDLTHTLHVSALDQVYIAIKNNASVTSAIIRSISFTFTPD